MTAGHDAHGHAHAQDHAHDHRQEGRWHRVRHVLVPHSHDAADGIRELRTSDETSRVGIRAAWIGLAGMSATAVLQVAIVAASGSVALLADTLHNVGHAITTIPLVIAFRLGRRAPSAAYPYGYRRAEDLVGLLIAAVIAASAVLVVVESVRALIDPPPLTHLGWVLLAGVVGAVGNELVAGYRMRAGRRIGSAALVAEGHHARVDGLTSLAVVVGVGGVWLGFPRADAVVGLVIAAVILGILVTTLRTTLRRLMDGVDPAVVARIEEVAAAVPGVEGVREVRARWSGHRLEADLAVVVDDDLTVATGHAIGEDVRRRLLHDVPHLDRTLVHLDTTG